ncbi:DUF6924 domain-containing protein [Streptomyces sp. MMS24-I31]|uniref:DUF6924 domain-containing protein n=1 Tax=Streptomyces sp. MMS24-I31 TaxID=3351563 RepID=UPI003896A604
MARPARRTGRHQRRWLGRHGPGSGRDRREQYPSTTLVVGNPAFEGLQPGQVPALVPSEEHTTLVALADARIFAEPGRPLTVFELYDTPGRQAVLPCREVGSMACNLEIANMDFYEFVAEEGITLWREGS